MAIQHEGLVVGDGLKKELPNDMSRSTRTIANGAGALPLFRVLGEVTASGEMNDYDPTAGDGTEVASAVLIAEADASSAAVPAPVIDWTALFAYNRLEWGPNVTTQAHRDAAIRQLRAQGIKVLRLA